MKLGFIGSGNMANAIIGGILNAGLAKPSEIIASNHREEGRNRTAKETGVTMTASNIEAVRQAEIIFLCVKPQALDGVIDEIKSEVRPQQIIVSIVAGRSLAYLEERFQSGALKIVRLMPNTPALVGEAMTAVCANAQVTEAELAQVMELIGSFGRAEIVPEHLFDTVTALSGSAPAYVFIFIEAMADEAVAGGMPRQKAYKFAAQAVLGSAKMVLETGKHPGELKDMVTSPAGTTIEAVKVLEKRGFRSAVMESMQACMERSAQL